MPKKVTRHRIEPYFEELRKKLPRNYKSELAKLLPELDNQAIYYAQEVRCKNLELKEMVKEKMLILAKRVQKRLKKLNKVDNI